MKFIPKEKKRPVREELISEDGNFTLTVDLSDEKPFYSIGVFGIDVCPGLGCGRSAVDAMEQSLKSLRKTDETIRKRIKMIEKMIEEVKTK